MILYTWQQMRNCLLQCGPVELIFWCDLDHSGLWVPRRSYLTHSCLTVHQAGHKLRLKPSWQNYRCQMPPTHQLQHLKSKH